MTQTKPRSLWAILGNASMLLYIVWLMLPAVQTTGRAVTGVLAVILFGAAVLADGETLPKHWLTFLPRIAFAALLPLALYFFVGRGGSNLAGYYAQQGMFWFPLLWCAYARERDDDRLYRFVWQTMLAAMVVTTLTTIGWLIEGMLREPGRVYAYSRSLGFGEEGREAYLKELMQRNIGGYDFVYATVLALPMTFFAAAKSRGWARAGFSCFYAAQVVMIVLSQYTYAIVFAAGVTAVELMALLLRAMFKRLTVGVSMLCTLPLFLALWLCRVPLLTLAGSVAAKIGFENAQYSLNQLLTLLEGGAVDSGSRLDAYRLSWQAFKASPLLGAMSGAARALGMHSDLLDLFAGLGVVGAAAFGLGAWGIGRGSLKGVFHCEARAQLLLQWLVFLSCMAVGTVFYSRELTLVMCLCATFALRKEKA